MESEKGVLGIVGSPNRAGRTHALVSAALEGAGKAGAAVELIQMSDHRAGPCRDCQPWVCATERKCTYEDEAFAFLSGKVLNCGALILGTPVYSSDTSGMIKYFILKMFRVFSRSAPLVGVPALGVSIAGGTGNGLVSGLRPLYHFFQMMQMRAIEPLPVTRFNFSAALQHAAELGQRIAGLVHQRTPFPSIEERLLWYDALPYLGLNRAGERRLLADLMMMALPAGADASIATGLARADALAVAGRSLEALTEIDRAYEAGAKVFEGK